MIDFHSEMREYFCPPEVENITELANTRGIKFPWDMRNKIQKNIAEIGTEPVNRNGKWMTRLKKSFFKTNNAEIPQDILTLIGEYASTALVRFSDKFDWEKGAYADSSSCYHSFNKATPVRFEQMGVKFLLAHDPGGKGIGRCFVWQRDGYALLWGARGRTSLLYADMLAKANGELEACTASLSPKNEAYGKRIYDFYNAAAIFPKGKKPEVLEKEDIMDHGYVIPECSTCGKSLGGDFDACIGRKLYCHDGACIPEGVAKL